MNNYYKLRIKLKSIKKDIIILFNSEKSLQDFINKLLKDDEIINFGNFGFNKKEIIMYSYHFKRKKESLWKKLKNKLRRK